MYHTETPYRTFFDTAKFTHHGLSWYISTYHEKTRRACAPYNPKDDPGKAHPRREGGKRSAREPGPYAYERAVPRAVCFPSTAGRTREKRNGCGRARAPQYENPSRGRRYLPCAARRIARASERRLRICKPEIISRPHRCARAHARRRHHAIRLRGSARLPRRALGAHYAGIVSRKSKPGRFASATPFFEPRHPFWDRART